MEKHKVSELHEFFTKLTNDPKSVDSFSIPTDLTAGLEKSYWFLLEAKMKLSSNELPKLEESINKIQQVIPKVQPEYIALKIDFIATQGHLYHRLLNYTKSRETYKRAEELFKSTISINESDKEIYPKPEYLNSYNIHEEISARNLLDIAYSIYNGLLVISLAKGDHTEADKYQESIEGITNQINKYSEHKSVDQYPLSMLFNIATYNRHKGYYNIAKKIYDNLLNDTDRNLDHIQFGIIYANLGLIYYDLSEYRTALECYEKTLLHWEQAKENTLDLRYPLQINLLMILCLVEINEIANADSIYHEKIEPIQSEDLTVNQYKLLAKGVMAYNKTPQQLSIAEIAFDEIIGDDILDFEATIVTITFLCDLLFNKLTISYNIDDAAKLEKHIQMMYELSDSRNTNRYMVKANMMKSKFINLRK